MKKELKFVISDSYIQTCLLCSAILPNKLGCRIVGSMSLFGSELPAICADGGRDSLSLAQAANIHPECPNDFYVEDGKILRREDAPIK